MSEPIDLSSVIAEIQVAIAFLNHFAVGEDWQARSQLLKRWQHSKHDLTVEDLQRLADFMKHQHKLVHTQIENTWLAGHGKDKTRIQSRLPL